MRLRPRTPIGDDEAPKRIPVVMDADGTLTWAVASDLEPVPLQEEFVFRALWDLDPMPADWTALEPDRTAELLDFMRAHGALWKQHPRATVMLTDSPQDHQELLDRRAARPRQDDGEYAVNHIADVVEWLRDLQRCTQHIVSLVRGESPTVHWDLDDDLARVRTRGEQPDPELWAHARFCDRVDAGLSQYTAGVEHPMSDVKGTWGVNALDLYGAGCVMIHDILLERPDVKFCKRERCQRPFLRTQPKPGQEQDRQKRGRSEGVLYCNPGCKDAQTQMDKERRRAERASAATTAEGDR